jgi:hypothetical protein
MVVLLRRKCHMSQGMKYTVDIVLCIDATGSMASIIERVKENAMSFYNDVSMKLKEKDKIVDLLRMKVVVSRDYYCDGDKAMIASQFFTLPAETESFRSFVKVIRAEGGGDEPENGLEAVALAINSEWSKIGDKRRQLIVIWTDASAHPLEKVGKPSTYPTDMPKDFDEITDMWDGQGAMSTSAKRLIIYAPDAYPWTDMAAHWQNTMHFPSKAGGGLADHEYATILDQIASSV